MPVSKKPRRKLSNVDIQTRLEKDKSVMLGAQKVLELLSKATKGKVSATKKDALMLALRNGF